MLTPFSNRSLIPILEAYQSINESAEDKNRKRAFQLSDQKLKEMGVYGQNVVDQDGNQQFSARTRKPWKYDHEFIDAQIGELIPNAKNLANAKFMLGVTRILFDELYKDRQNLQTNASTLNKILKLVASPAHVDEYDHNLNGQSLSALKAKFMGAVQKDLDDDRSAVSSGSYKQNGSYSIVRIKSFEDAEKYGDYTSWCVTHYPEMFSSYTNGGMGVFYFCLKKGFENVEDEAGENAPFDEYGLSMIAVSVNDDGSLNTCTTRWNHSHGGNDNMMDTKQLSELLGVNFYEVFKPLTKEEIEENMYKLVMDAFGLKKDAIKRGEDGSMSFVLPFDMLKHAFDDNRRDSLSFDTVKSILTGEAVDALNTDYYTEIEFIGLDTSAFDRKLKPYGIDFSLIRSMYEYDDNPSDYDIPDDKYEEIGELVHNDFYNGVSMRTCYGDCCSSGAAREAEDDVTRDFFASFPADMDYGLRYNDSTKDYEILVKLSKSDVSEFGKNYADGEMDAATALTEGGGGIGIYEPRYGWGGFDDGLWNEALGDFADRVIDIMDTPEKQKDAKGQQFFDFDKDYLDNPKNRRRK